MDSFYELAKNRRSIRKYLNQPVEKEKLDAILQVALMSPAGKRANGWEFIVIDDHEKLEKMAQCREFGSKFVANAPVAIVVAYDPQKSDVWFADASIAAIYIQLAAADFGLGSCWVQVYNRQYNAETTAEDYIKNLLEIPEHFHVLNIVTLGYKDEERKPYDVEKLSYNKIHKNKF